MPIVGSQVILDIKFYDTFLVISDNIYINLENNPRLNSPVS